VFTGRHIVDARLLFKKSIGSNNITKTIAEYFKNASFLTSCLIVFKSKSEYKFAIYMSTDGNESQTSFLVNISKNLNIIYPKPTKETKGFKF
jgi:hypothetical protein